MISTAISMRPGQSTSPHLVITNASPCGPSGISSRAEAQKMSRWCRNLRFEIWMRLECIEPTATPTDVVLYFFGCLAMIGSSQVQIVLTLLTLTVEFVMVPGFAKASNDKNHNFNLDFCSVLSEIFHVEQKQKSSPQVFTSQPLSLTECKAANIPWLNIFIRGKMTGDLVMLWTWCHSKCCKNIYDIVTCPWLCNDVKGHDLS